MAIKTMLMELLDVAQILNTAIGVAIGGIYVMFGMKAWQDTEDLAAFSVVRFILFVLRLLIYAIVFTIVVGALIWGIPALFSWWGSV